MEKAILSLRIKANIKGDKNANHPDVGKLTATHFEVYKRMFEEEIDSLTGLFPATVNSYSNKSGTYDLIVYVVQYGFKIRKENGRPEEYSENSLNPVEFVLHKVDRLNCFVRAGLFNTEIQTDFAPFAIVKESEIQLIRALDFLLERIKNIGYIDPEYKEEIINTALEAITYEG